MSILAWCFSLAILTAPPDNEVTYTVNSPRFMVPIYIRSQAERDTIDSLIIYSSCDKGKTWRAVTRAFPGQTHFQFSASADGTYWFAVQVIYRDNTKEPSVIDNAEPQLRVAVVTGRKSIRRADQQNELEREVNRLRDKVEALKKRIAELEKQNKTKQ